MNIVIFVSSLQFGGAQKQAVLDANLLATDHRVFLYAFSGGPLQQQASEKVEVELIGKDGYLRTALRVRKRIRRNRIDIIHASLFAPIVISTLASIFTHTRVIWHFHSHEYDAPARSNMAFRWLAKWPNVRKVLFVNHELLGHFLYLKFPAGKTEVQHNHSEISNPGVNRARHTQDTLHIGYLGRVIGLKRVDYLVGLAEYFLDSGFSGFKIHIVGDGEALSGIKGLAVARQVADHIIFHGFQADVASFYQKFDLFVNPSQEECLSIAMIDAGMMALPIVAYDVGGNNEIVVNGKTGYIVREKGDFFQKCRLLAQDENIRQAFGKAAREHCYNLFSKEKHTEELLGIYNEALYAH
ncbi:MAG: glycosyltransferase family 4 protein [Lewinellaceae bacterium]|nr:glycosyltransferase family 4 protein [Lewinellaceae bacterium]